MSASNQKSFGVQLPRVDAQIFDIEHFERQTFGDANLQREILQLFMAQIEDTRKALTTPMTATSWRFLTHTLKGAAASVGAIRLADIAGEWELQGTPKDGEARAAIMELFTVEAARLEAVAVAFQR